jgi:hypothetical protein
MTTKTNKKTDAKHVDSTVHVSETTAAATTGTTPAPSPAVTTASPFADRVTQAIAYIKEAVAILALNPPALTAAQRKGMAKLRKGGDKIIPQVAQIAQQWSVQIRTQPTAAMTSAALLASQLQPLLTVLAGFLQEAQDTGYQAQSDAWSTASALYAVLKRMSKKDPKLAAQLAPAAEFFQYRHPVVKEQAKKKKNGTEAKRSAKELSQAEAIVAEQPATPEPAAAPATNVAQVAHA